MTDPLVTALIAAAVADCRAGEGVIDPQGDMVRAERALADAAQRLSAVLAAARALTAAIRDDDSEPSSTVEWRTEQLERALAAADGAR